MYVRNIGFTWRAHNLEWAELYSGRVHIVHFNDLIDNLEKTLRGILKFIDHTIDENLLECALSKSKGLFKRKKPPIHFFYYTEIMKDWLDQVKKFVYKRIAKFAAMENEILKLNLTRTDFNASRRDCPKGLNDDDQ